VKIITIDLDPTRARSESLGLKDIADELEVMKI